MPSRWACVAWDDFNARKLDECSLVANAQLAGATPMLEWIGDSDAAIFSY